MNNNKQKPLWRSFLIYGSLLLGICLLLYYYREAYEGVREFLRFFSSRRRINAYIASFGCTAPLVFMALQIFQVLFAPIPGELTGFIGGYLFGVAPGLVYSTIGLTTGSIGAFLISRRLGMPFVRRFVKEDLMKKFDYLMEHKGALFSFFLFLIPGTPKDYLCYLLGLSPIHFGTFLVVSTIGRLPGTLLLTMQGQAVRSEDYRSFFVVMGLALLFLVLTIIYRDQVETWLKKKTHLPGRRGAKK